MQLNNMSPAEGERKNRKRVARGVGSGTGKTAGRGHKGQHARNGNSHTPGFEGGQMPLQRRLPKVGFHSRKARESAQVFLYHLNTLEGDQVDLATLRKAGLVRASAKRVKIVKRGELTRAFKVSGVLATAGAKAAIEAAGGSVE